jgi:hypothetical protein
MIFMNYYYYFVKSCSLENFSRHVLSPGVSDFKKL